MSSPGEKLESLQIIRAVAMLMVLFAHVDIFSGFVLNSTFLFSVFRLGGGAGVDLFFVLSGFIITFVHQKDIGSKSKSIPYLIKRFTRIYPAYWAVNLIIIPLHFLFPQFGAGDERQLQKIFDSVLLLPQTHAPIVHAAWSLTNEVYFYLLFGLLIFIGFKKMLPLLVIILVGTFFESFFALSQIDIFPNPWIKLIFSYYNIEFALGCLAAFLITRYKINQRKTFLISGITLFFLMVIYEWLQGDILSLRVYLYGIPSFLIITSLSSYELNDPKILLKIAGNNIWRLLKFLGDASFSIYITHQLLISAIGRTLISSGFVNRFGEFITLFIITTATIVLGCAFHILIEKPLLLLSRNKLLSLYNKNSKTPAKA